MSTRCRHGEAEGGDWWRSSDYAHASASSAWALASHKRRPMLAPGAPSASQVARQVGATLDRMPCNALRLCRHGLWSCGLREYFPGAQELPSSTTRSATLCAPTRHHHRIRRGLHMLCRCAIVSRCASRARGSVSDGPSGGSPSTGRSGALFVFIHRRHTDADVGLAQPGPNQAQHGPPTHRPAWLGLDWATG